MSRDDLNMQTLLCLVFNQKRQLRNVEAVSIASYKSESVASSPSDSGCLTGAGKVEICSETGGSLGDIASFVPRTYLLTVGCSRIPNIRDYCGCRVDG